MVQKRMGYFLSMWLLAALLVACGPLPQTSATVEPCPPSDSTPNVYRIAPEPWVHDVYNHVAAADPASKETMYWEARFAAFQILGHQTQRWSDFVDLELPELGSVRLTITYLSPQLIETILLNNMLVNGQSDYPDGVFTAKVSEGLTKLAQRDETLFLITITAPRYGSGTSNQPPTTLDIPLKSLMLTNSSNLVVGTKHDDHSLNEHIRLMHGPFSGLITYQMTVKNGESCGLLLDPAVNTSISIHLPGLKIDEVDREQQTWTIRYESLLGGAGPARRRISQSATRRRISKIGSHPHLRQIQSASPTWNLPSTGRITGK